MKPQNLTAKELMFCNEYLIDLNGAKAAIRAGYSDLTAKEQAYGLMQKKKIIDKIAELNKERMERVKADGDFVIKEFLNIANDDIANYMTLTAGKNGKLTVKWKDLSKLDTKNIAELSQDKNGFKFKRYNRDTALIQLGRHFGVFEDKLTIKSNLEKILSEYHENGILTDDGINKLAAIILDHHKKIQS